MFRWKVAGVLLCVLLFWELITRLFVLSPAQEVLDSHLGYLHAPHASILRTYEGYARLTLDQFGLNNEPLPEVLPAKRVFVVGDSLVEAYQVMRDENFVSRLRNKWKDSLWFNVGIAGTAPDQWWTAYDKFKSQIKPTHVLLCVTSSDLYELLLAKEHRDAKGALTVLFQPVDKPSRFVDVKLWLYEHSALVTHLTWKYKNDIRAWLAGDDNKQPIQESYVFVGGELQRAVEYWRFVLKKFQASGVTLTVLIMPELDYFPNKKVQLQVRQGYAALVNEATKLGIPILDSNAAFIQDFEKSGQPANGFSNTHYGKGHLNAHGHQVLADWLDEQRDVILR